MKKAVTKTDVINALRENGEILHIDDILEAIYIERGYDISRYKDYNSFANTVQAIVNRHCRSSKMFNGTEYFKRVNRGGYQLVNDPIPNATQKLLGDLKDVVINSEQDNVIRKLREINLEVRNPKIVRVIKVLHNNTCQIRKAQLQIAPNSFYSEIHHIQPLGTPHNGPDIIENMLCVCPNCHIQLDYGYVKLESEKVRKDPKHPLGARFFLYHNDKIFSQRQV